MVFVIVACGPCGSNDGDFDVAVCDDGGGKSGNDEGMLQCWQSKLLTENEIVSLINQLTL